MRLAEGAIVDFVAGNTELRVGLGEQIALRRSVGEMTCPAPLFLQDLVHDLLAVVLLFVTLEAYCVPLGTQEIGGIGGVRIVTGSTRSLLQRSVNSRRVQLQILDGVAFVTDLVALLLEQKLAHNSMPKVAVFAFSVLDHSVEVWHGEVLLAEFLVTVQALLTLEFPLLRVGRGDEAQEDDTAAEEGHPNQRCSTLRMCSQHFFADRRMSESSRAGEHLWIRLTVRA